MENFATAPSKAQKADSAEADPANQFRPSLVQPLPYISSCFPTESPCKTMHLNRRFAKSLVCGYTYPAFLKKKGDEVNARITPYSPERLLFR
jgi:hypothetical protein